MASAWSLFRSRRTQDFGDKFGRRQMKILLCTLAIAVGGGLIVVPAEAQNYPWCAHYSVEGAAVNCGFVSFPQCMATLNGIGGICMRNTQFAPYASPGGPGPLAGP